MTHHGDERTEKLGDLCDNGLHLGGVSSVFGLASCTLVSNGGMAHHGAAHTKKLSEFSGNGLHLGGAYVAPPG
jgi:hypothetical protein